MTRRIMMSKTWVSGANANLTPYTVTVTVELDGDMLTDVGLSLACHLIEIERATLRKRKARKADARALVRSVQP